MTEIMTRTISSVSPADVERNLPRVVLENKKGSCWSCERRNLECDRILPYCRGCTENGRRCSGYGVRLQWPNELAKRRTQQDPSRKRPNSRIASKAAADSVGGSLLVRNKRGSEAGQPRLLSTLGLPEGESYLMQHYLKNISRVALAVDYSGNGYRSLLSMAMQEPCLLNGILAVSASHHSRWQKTTDLTSRGYLKTAVVALQERFKRPELVNDEVTIASILVLISYEVFNGSSRWKIHHEAAKGWIRARGGDGSDLNPFIKTWICMIDTQCALNLGTSAMPELQPWLDSTLSWEEAETQWIDPLFGCAARLPRLMFAAARLYDDSHSALSAICMPQEEILQRTSDLQEQILSTKINFLSPPSLCVSCHPSGLTSLAVEDLNISELSRRIVATAEIFRHATHVYVFRIAHDMYIAPSPEIRASIEEGLKLLTQVPDALGPGSNLGWCLVVLGSEIESAREADRSYVRSRWAGMHSLGMGNTKSAEKILEQVWRQRDELAQNGGGDGGVRWQDVMIQMGESQILV